MMDATRAVLDERGKTHGYFPDHAAISQTIKAVLFHPHECVEGLSDATRRDASDRYSAAQREALDMIAHKLGRIVAGNPDEPDHWVDIAGYARLAADELQREPDLPNGGRVTGYSTDPSGAGGDLDMTALALEMRDQPLREAGETFEG